MKITKRQLRNVILEAITLDLKVGDVVLTGRFKNKRVVVKEIGKDQHGHPTVNGKSILKFKIEKYLPKSDWSKQTKEEKKK